jgi:hypothetical protein
MSTDLLFMTSYCERGGDQFWAEPLNAVTNLAFVLAAALIGLRLRSASSVRPELGVLVALTVAVGIGSFLWHTLARPWSQWADVVPIGLFIVVFLLSLCRRVLQWSWSAALAASALFLLGNGVALALLPPDLLNDSGMYLPAWLALLAAALYCRYRGSKAAAPLASMTGVFSAALLLRWLDAALCPLFATGTHFAWHLAVAMTMYLGMRLLVD